MPNSFNAVKNVVLQKIFKLINNNKLIIIVCVFIGINVCLESFKAGFIPENTVTHTLQQLSFLKGKLLYVN
jgi:hypothetical protein